MARYVLPVVGAVVGFIYGGPAGASLGWSLGAAVGGLVDPQVIKGPGIGDIAQQTSQEGVPRPIVFGLSQPIAGNVIVSGEPRVVKKKKSGKGGPKVETETVYRTYAIRICEGPIAKVLRVWKNNQLVYDARPGSGMTQDNAEFLKTARFFLGTFTQNPSPDIEALFGAGTTPAHRGTAYMVMADDDLTDMRGAIPQFQFQVTSASIGQVFGDGDGWEYQTGAGVIVPPDPSTWPVPSSGWGAAQPAPFGFTPVGRTPIGPINTNWPPATWIWMRRTFQLGIVNNLQLTLTAENSGYVYWDGVYVGAHNPSNAQGGDGTSVINIPSNLATPGEHTMAIYGLDESSSVSNPSNSFTYMRPILAGTGSDLALSTVVSRVCDAAGMEQSMYDVSALTDVVAGITLINTYPAYTILQSLSQVFFFLPSNYDGVLHFVKGGGNSVATITESDMVDDNDQDVEQTQRDDSIAVPRVMHLLYYDVDGGLATDKQTSERAGDRRAVGEQSMQSAVMMYSTQAARAVAVNHKVSIEELRGSLRFCLPDSWLELVPANPVIVQWNGRSERCRITKLEVLDGYQQYELYHDRQSSYTSIVEGIPAAPQTPPPSNIIGPTLVEPLDIHILRDADDNAGLIFYVAISGTQPAWTGALVELSLDGGQNYIDSVTSGVDSTMGVLEAELPDHPQSFPDVVHTLAVQINTPYAEFEETDLAGLLNRKNLAIVGDEIIQFAEADETSEGHWELTTLLRGRKGTQTQSHAIGTRFVLLDPGALGVIPASIVDIGRTFTFRATSFGESEDTATIVSMVYVGRSQREREAAYLRARIDGSNALVEWQGVGRLGSGAQVAHGARFTGYHLTFEGSGTGDVAIEIDTTAQSYVQDVSSLSQPIRVAVSQVNSLTGEGPEIEVYI